jgi:type IV pilus assembly protein PilB
VEVAAKLPPPLPAALTEHARLPLGSLLVRDGLITAEQLELALAEKEETGHRLGEIVLAHGWVVAAALAQLLAEQHGLEYVDLPHTAIEPAAAGLLPEKLARRYEAMPIRFLSEKLVLVAVSDPTNVVASDDLRLALGLNVRIAVAAAPDVLDAIAREYRPHHGAVIEPNDDTELGAEDIRGSATSAPAISLVNSLIAQAIDEGASDLHFEPQAKEMVVRIRVDGVARNLATIAKEMQPAVTSRLKIMAELDIAERRAPQDGRMSVRVGGSPMDLRCAVLPTTHGEQIVLRIMNRTVDGGRLGLAELGMAPAAEEALRGRSASRTARCSRSGRPAPARRRRSTPRSISSTTRVAC